MKTHTVVIDGLRISDWDSFHDVFKEVLGFPDFYGRNMDAWIDCMGDIHDDTGMLNVTLPNETALILEIHDTRAVQKLNSEIFHTLVEYTAFVNRERIKFKDKSAAPIHLVLYS
jgi:RNAse (barnase) inhibitor barstar